MHIDVNECREASDLCHHFCINTLGAYTCGCEHGYNLQEDGISCEGLGITDCDCKCLHQIRLIGRPDSMVMPCTYKSLAYFYVDLHYEKYTITVCRLHTVNKY